VAKKFIELHDFEVPQTLLRRELNFLVERRLRELSSLGIDTRYINVQGVGTGAFAPGNCKHKAKIHT
jgi:trigger factor